MKTVLLCAVLLWGCATAPLGTIRRGWQGADSPIEEEISRLLSASTSRIDLAVVGAVDTVIDAQSFRAEGGDLTKWREIYSFDLVSRQEERLRKRIPAKNGFSVVARGKALNAVMRELARSASLNFSDEMRISIGRLKLATHLVYVYGFRNREPNGKVVDTITARLLDVNTGDILATQSETWTNP